MPYTETLAENYLQAKEAERVNAQSGEDPLFTAIAGDSKDFVGGIPKETWDKMTPEARKEFASIPKPIQTLLKGTGSALVGAPMAVGGAILGTAAGGAIGKEVAGIPGTVAAGILGGTAGAAAGGNLGGQIGSDLVDHYIQKHNNSATPSTRTRDELQREFDSAKGRE